MAVFTYRASHGTARPVTGTIAADSPRQARDQLRSQGLRVRRLDAASAARSATCRRRAGLRLPQMFQRRRGTVALTLCRELSTLLAAGIPLLQALDTMVRQYRRGTRRTLLIIRDEVARGASLAEAMRAQPGVFDPLAVSMVEVGERAGTLDEVLAQLAEFKGRVHRFRGKLATALIYPAIVLTAGLGVTLFLMTFVVPQLLETLVAAGQPLPWATHIVKGGSDLLIERWGLLVAIAAGLALAGAVLHQLPRVRWWTHWAWLRTPLLGDLATKQAVVQIAIALSALTRSGVELVEAMRIVRASVACLPMRDGLAHAEAAIHAGRDIGPAFEATDVFPATMVQIITVGQSSGQLDVVLTRLAEDYDEQVQVASQRLLAVMEPAAILLLASVVGFVVLAVILPYLEAGNVL